MGKQPVNSFADFGLKIGDFIKPQVTNPTGGKQVNCCGCNYLKYIKK